ncbi:MAG: POTRA domain-containing protein [Acidobacteriota bacterium]
MKRRPSRLLAIVWALTACAALAPAAAPAGGPVQEAPAAAVISKVIVRVDGVTAGGSLAELITLKPGDPFSPADVDRVVKQVFKTGLFSDVSVARAGELRVELTFSLRRNVTVRRVSFHGAGVKSSKLREALETLRPGSIFLEDRLPRAIEDIKEGLKREGYFEAEVTAETTKRDDDPRIDISFQIARWKRYRIRSIDLRGPIVEPAAKLRKRMKSRRGDIYVPSRLTNDIRALENHYTSLGYRRSDIQIAGERFDEAAKAVDLELEIQPREKIIIVVNGTRIPSSLLAPIWEERIFEEWGLAEGEVRILNHLRKKGYVYATLTSRIERPENEIQVIYDVVPGKRYQILKVSFRGLKSFSAQRLREELAVTERTLFFSLMTYDKLFALPREIEYFYQAHGFTDVRAELELPRTEKGVNAILKVDEGPRKTIQSITVSGTRLVAPEEILKQLVDVKDGPYFGPNVQRDAGLIENYYLNHGFRGTRVSSRIEPAGENLFALTFEIEEGTPVIIRNILITGNRTTRTSVVEKEIRVRQGAPADFSLIQESKRGLERLGIFSDVRADEVLTAPGQENLVVAVQEGEVNYAGAGLGFESRDAVPSSEPVQFRPRATGEYIRSNVFGLAAQLSVMGQYSNVERRAIVSWSQPYLFGAALRPSLLGWIEREDRTSCVFERRGGSFNLSKLLQRNLIVIGTFSWSRTDLSHLEVPETEIDRRLQHYATTLFSVSVALDRRDDSFNPEKGYFVSVVSELAKPLFGTESDFWKTFYKFQYFKPVAPQFVFSLLSRVGLAQGTMSLPERFFAGGSNSFRGRYFDYLGPKDAETDKPVGGQALLLLNTEMRFPIIPTFRELSGGVFFDLGNVFSAIRDIRVGDLEAAVGFGLRYKTALGPVRLETAWNLGAPDGRKKALFFITIGNVF